MQMFNLSKKSEYHTQRNNKRIPFRACNTTSMVMALKQAWWPIRWTRPDEQEEDTLTRFLLTPQAYDKMRELAPWAYDKKDRAIYPPNEVHVMLEWAVNYLMDEKVVDFTTRATFDSIIRHLLHGGGIVLSGIFKVNDKDLRHIVSLAGFYTNQNVVTFKNLNIAEVTHTVIDDPYGNYQTNYRDHRGNDILMPIDEFNTIFKEPGLLNQKWAHFIKPYEGK